MKGVILGGLKSGPSTVIGVKCTWGDRSLESSGVWVYLTYWFAKGGGGNGEWVFIFTGSVNFFLLSACRMSAVS